MNKALHYSLLIFSFGLIFSLSTVREARAQGITEEALRRMDVYNKSLQSLSADVTMVKTNAQLNVSDTTYGNTSYLPKTAKRGTYVRINWTKPVEEQISVRGDDYELYQPRLNQVYVGKVNKAKNSASVGGALSFMNMSKAQLKANYSITNLGEEQISGGIRTLHLQLTPNAPTSYKLAEIWIDKDGVPRQAKVVEKNSDSTTVLLSNIERNITMKAEIFKLKYPGSVKKIPT